MPSSSSPSSKQLCAMRRSTLGLCSTRFNRFDGMAAAGLRPFGQWDPGIRMFSPARTLQCIRAGPELQGFQRVRMRWWLRWCDVHGLRFQISMLPEALARSAKIMIWNFQILGYSPRSLWQWLLSWRLRLWRRWDTQNQRWRRYVATRFFTEFTGANPNSGANSLTALSLGDVKAFRGACFTFQIISTQFPLILRFSSLIYMTFVSKLQGQLWGVLAALRKTTTDDLISLLGDPIHWDSSVLTLECEGSVEPSMQVRRLALKFMVGIMRWQVSRPLRRFLPLWLNDYMTLNVFKVWVGLSSDSANTRRMDLRFAWDLPSWLRSSPFWWYRLAWFWNSFPLDRRQCNAQGLRIEENLSHEIKICSERLLYRARKMSKRLVQNIREGRGETKNLRLAKWFQLFNSNLEAAGHYHLLHRWGVWDIIFANLPRFRWKPRCFCYVSV